MCTTTISCAYICIYIYTNINLFVYIHILYIFACHADEQTAIPLRQVKKTVPSSTLDHVPWPCTPFFRDNLAKSRSLETFPQMRQERPCQSGTETHPISWIKMPGNFYVHNPFVEFIALTAGGSHCGVGSICIWTEAVPFDLTHPKSWKRWRTELWDLKSCARSRDNRRKQKLVRCWKQESKTQVRGHGNNITSRSENCVCWWRL